MCHPCYHLDEIWCISYSVLEISPKICCYFKLFLSAFSNIPSIRIFVGIFIFLLYLSFIDSKDYHTVNISSRVRSLSVRPTVDMNM